MLEGIVLNADTSSTSRLRDAPNCSRWRWRRMTTTACTASRPTCAEPKKIVAEMEFRRMFSGEMDPNNCFLDIQAGSGGTEAQDWAAMLLRMYLRYCERKGFKVEVLEESDGEVAGIKSASIKIDGRIRLRLPAHRNRRAPPGAQVARSIPATAATPRSPACSSIPEVDDSIEIDINPADLRIDTYRASGAGGQHINKTDSAMRITHIPTNIVVQCQNDRSQHRNRAEAMAMLKSRLYEAELRKRQCRAAGAGRLQDRHRLGPPDPLLCAGPVAHQGSAHQLRSRQHPGRAGRRPGRFHRSQFETRCLTLENHHDH